MSERTDYIVRITVDRSGRRDDTSVIITFDFGQDVPTGPRTVSEAVPESLFRAALQHADRYYYFDDPLEDEHARDERLKQLGRKLYALLDTPQGWLSGFLANRRGGWTVVVLALTVAEGLAHLPWELLHDGTSYLVATDKPVVPVRVVHVNPTVLPPAQRPLRVLFMACAPRGSPYTPDYQAEEATIDDVALSNDLPLDMDYVPSGNLGELKRWLTWKDENYFDVVHITGHATRSMEQAVFVTETMDGEPAPAGAEDFIEALFGARPRIIILSGCRTAESGDLGSAPSLAQELAEISAPMVIGWGRPVDDRVATLAMKDLYRLLMSGRSPALALAHTYRRLIETDRSPWHCLRMFVQGEPSGPLVVAVSKMRWDKISFNRARPLMPYGLAQVARYGFVGRRGEIHTLWRCLDPRRNSPHPGAIVHGIGGIGKTTLVSRVLDLLPDDVSYIPIDRKLSPESLRITMRSRSPVLANTLGSARPDEDLTALLTRTLDQADRPVVFVLDEFERNIRNDGEDALLTHETAQALTALITALLQSRQRHRLVITCRYKPVVAGIDKLVDMHLEPLDGVYLKRKIDRLQESAGLDATTVQVIVDMARENTRLLDYPFGIARDNPALQTDLLRRRLQERRAKFYDDLIVNDLVKRQDPQAARLLRLITPIRIPVDIDVLARLTGPSALLTADKVLSAARREVAERAARLARWHLLEQSDGPDGGVAYRLPAVLEPHLRGSNQGQEYARCAAALAAELQVHEDILNPDLLDLSGLNEVYRLAVAGEVRELVVRSALVLANAAGERYRFTEAAEICRGAIDIAPHSLLFARLGNALAEQGDSRAARSVFSTALENTSGLTDRDHARVLATVAFWAGYYSPTDQSRLLEQALALARSAGDILTEADCLRLIAGGIAKSRQWNRARELYDESIQLIRTLPGSRRPQNLVVMDRASMEITAGNTAAAQADLKYLLAEYQRPGMKLHEAAVRIRMSEAHRLNQEFDRAQAEAERSRELAAAVGWSRGEFEAVAQLSSIAVECFNRTSEPEDRHHLQSAIAFMEQGRDMADAIGWPILRRTSLQSLASLYRLGRRDADADRLESALTDAEGEDAESPLERADRLMLTAEIRQADGRPDEAMALARHALALLTADGSQTQEARARRIIAQIGDEREDSAAELENHLQRLLEIYPLVDPTALPLIHYWIARMFLREEQPQRAREQLQQSAEGYAAAGDLSSQAVAHELWSGLPGIDADEKIHHLRTAARLRWSTPDHAATATALRELAAARPTGSKERTLRAGLLLARAAGAYTVEGQILTDLHVLLPPLSRTRAHEDGQRTGAATR